MLNKLTMKNQDVISGFKNVDQSSEAAFFIKFLDDGNKLPSVLECKRRMEKRMHIREGDTILDVGCGTGDDDRQLATRAANVKVTGIDSSEAMINVAKERQSRSHTSVEFYVANATQLPFNNNSFDSCRSERVLMLVPDAPMAIKEMVRVTKTGGRIVIYDFEWDAHVIYHPDRKLTRNILRFMSDASQNGWIGSHLQFLLKNYEVKEVEVVPHSLFPHLEFLQRVFGVALTTAINKGIFSQQEIEGWWAELKRLDDEKNYFVSFQGFIASGTK
jgi:ubiquinone/menaquinone biosynthesis C-methylase UbiE